MKNYKYLPGISEEFINKQKYLFQFETKKFDRSNYKSYIFYDPIDIITVINPTELREAFDKIEKYSKNNFIAGFISYETGYYLDKAFQEIVQDNPISSSPFMSFCVFNKAVEFDHRKGVFVNNSEQLPKSSSEKKFEIKDLQLSIIEEEYKHSVDSILDYIKKGDVYQVNYTARCNFSFQGSAYNLYRSLSNCQKVSYSAFLKFDNKYVLSFSPELFFKRNGMDITSKPMKGTIKRGKNTNEDKINRQALLLSEKDRAENTMIVDLIRNDLGKICESGSITVPQLYNIEKYDTLFQMTSTVKGRLKKSTSYFDIFNNIFPCGSVTGAPKIRSMKIIKDNEENSRGVYCGAVGIIFPGKRAVFNVPIRTVEIERDKGTLGIGSGIVADSDPKSEYEECLLKAKFLTEMYPEFRLLETVLWENGYTFLKEHIRRMCRSAEYFDFKYDRSRIMKNLTEFEKSCNFERDNCYRVRVLLTISGGLEFESQKIRLKDSENKFIMISGKRINSDNIFQYHKTTNRVLYDEEYSRISKLGFYDVLFLNERGEVTEGAISNIIIEKEGEFLTPPVSCGLLPGIFRENLIKNRKVREKVMYPDDIINAESIFLCNSVRGKVKVELKN
ncbi:aminodeoxychorismate synthase component I [candidate division KSB1 bacterium]